MRALALLGCVLLGGCMNLQSTHTKTAYTDAATGRVMVEQTDCGFFSTGCWHTYTTVDPATGQLVTNRYFSSNWQ